MRQSWIQPCICFSDEFLLEVKGLAVPINLQPNGWTSQLIDIDICDAVSFLGARWLLGHGDGGVVVFRTILVSWSVQQEIWKELVLWNLVFNSDKDTRSPWLLQSGSRVHVHGRGSYGLHGNRKRYEFFQGFSHDGCVAVKAESLGEAEGRVSGWALTALYWMLIPAEWF